jgi:RCC1 and BTB domain-containing protein
MTSTFAGDIRSLIDQPDFADVVFIVEGQRIFSHRAILAARSDHFKVCTFKVAHCFYVSS